MFSLDLFPSFYTEKMLLHPCSHYFAFSNELYVYWPQFKLFQVLKTAKSLFRFLIFLPDLPKCKPYFRINFERFMLIFKAEFSLHTISKYNNTNAGSEFNQIFLWLLTGIYYFQYNAPSLFWLNLLYSKLTNSKLIKPFPMEMWILYNVLVIQHDNSNALMNLGNKILSYKLIFR